MCRKPIDAAGTEKLGEAVDVVGTRESIAVLRSANFERRLIGQLRHLTEKHVAVQSRSRLDHKVADLLAEVVPALRGFVLLGWPLPEGTLSSVAEVADELVAAGVPRCDLVKATRRFAVIAADTLMTLGTEAGPVTAEASGRALVATHDLVSALLTGQSGGAAGPGENKQIDSLERGILTMVARGLSTVETAKMLHYSRQAVSYHLSRLMARFEVPNRTALVAFAYEHGLLPSRCPQARDCAAPDPRASRPPGRRVVR